MRSWFIGITVSLSTLNLIDYASKCKMYGWKQPSLQIFSMTWDEERLGTN